MLRLFAPRVEILEIREERLTFRCPRSLPVGKQQVVKLELPDGPRSFRVLIESVRPLARGGFACIGVLQSRIELQAPEGPPEDAFLRKKERLDCVMRVLSPDLPGYRAVTVDFSHGGIQIETEGPLQVGMLLDLTMEFDSQQMPAVRCQARVAWSSERARARYRAGLQFVTPGQEVERQLAWIESFLANRENSTIMQRTLACNDQVLSSRTRDLPPVQHPLSGVLESYAMREGQITAWVLQGDERIQLTFPETRTVKDYASYENRPLAFLREASGSELLTQVARKHAARGGWRHYQLVDVAGEIVMELVSQPAGRPGVLTKEQIRELWNELWEQP